MKPSKRIAQTPHSPIRKLVPFANEAKERGIKVHHLNIGQPDFELPELIKKELQKSAQRTHIKYCHSNGIEPARQAWSDYYHQVNIEYTKDQILVTTGGTEAIILSLFVTLDPGDEVLVFEPGYANYNGYSVLTGVTLKPVTLKPEDGFHLTSEAEIEKAISPKTKAVLITTPNNPTGTVLTDEEMALIVKLAKKHNLFIIADETYRGIVFDNRKASSFYHPAQKAGILDQLIIVDSLSKRLNVCGARIGALATTNETLFKEIVKIAQNRLCVATLEQEIVAPMLSNCLEYVDKIKNEYQKRRDALYQLFSQEPDISLTKPEGAFYTLPTLPVNGEAFAKWLLTDFDDGGETVMVAPGAGFYFTPGLGENQIRVAYVLNQKDLTRAAQILIKGLNQFKALRA